jgi:hypothetical protein
MSGLESEIDNLIQVEFNNPTGSLGNIVNDHLLNEGYQGFTPLEILMFNDWQGDVTPTGWKELARWFWAKVKEFVLWLWDLIS